MQFHEGQEVEVFKIITPPAYGRWHKATIVYHYEHADGGGYEVQFPGGPRGVFDAGDIRVLDASAYVGRNWE
jgi:hypothetical protein